MWGCRRSRTGANIAPCPSGAYEHGLRSTANSSPMKTARRYQGPGRSQMRRQSSALLQNNPVPLIELSTGRKSMSKTSVNNEKMIPDRSRKSRLRICTVDVNSFFRDKLYSTAHVQRNAELSGTCLLLRLQAMQACFHHWSNRRCGRSRQRCFLGPFMS